MILVGNKTDLARKREVSPKVLLKKQITFLGLLLSVISRRAETRLFFTDQNLLKLEQESGTILINFWLVSSFNQGIRNIFKFRYVSR